MLMTEDHSAVHDRNDLHEDINYLSPDYLETTNRVLLETRGKLDLFSKSVPDRLVAAGYFFNKHTRTFHSHLVWGKESWKLNINIQQIDDYKLKKHVESQEKAINNILEIFSTLDNEIVGGNLQNVKTNIPSEIHFLKMFYEDIKKCKNLCFYERENVLKHNYSHLPISPDEFAPGLLLSALSGESNISKEILSNLAFLVANVNIDDECYLTKVIPMTWRSDGNHGWDAQQHIMYEKYQNPKSTNPITKIRRDVYLELAEHFYMNKLKLYFEFEKAESAKWTQGSAILVLPVFDTWIEGRGYGGLWGVILCSFFNSDCRDAYVYPEDQERNCRLRELPKSPNTKIFHDQKRKNILLELLADNERLSDEYFAAGLVKMIRTQIFPPYDWLILFVKNLHWIQDWERVTVNNGDTRLVCYRHFQKNGTIESSWDQCNLGSDKCAECLERSKAARVFRWSELGYPYDGGHPILNPKLVKEISQVELDQFHNIDIEFQFPVTTVFPPEKSQIEHYFYLAIARQHIAALRNLLPIVRARQSALRTAAVSIMSRNMSHNIGSHVLSRVSAKLARSSLGPDEREDQREDLREDLCNLIQYIEERHDFLAEIATAVSTFSMPFSLARVADHFNNQKLISRHISGLQNTPSNLKSASHVVAWPKDCRIAVNGGAVGLHALFIIIENVMRNTAKHNAHAVEKQGINTLYVDWEQLQDISYSGWVRFRVWETISDPYRERELNQSDLTWLRDEHHEAYGVVESVGESGSRRTIPQLNFIRAVLELYPFLDETNKPRPNFWGLREMQICAARLRGRDLSDLEARLPKHEPRSIGAQLSPIQPIIVLVNGTHHLGYEFFLPLARILLVASDKTRVAPEKIAELRREGIVFLTSAEITRNRITPGDLRCSYALIAVEHERLINDTNLELPILRWVVDGEDLAEDASTLFSVLKRSLAKDMAEIAGYTPENLPEKLGGVYCSTANLLEISSAVIEFEMLPRDKTLGPLKKGTIIVDDHGWLNCDSQTEIDNNLGSIGCVEIIGKMSPQWKTYVGKRPGAERRTPWFKVFRWSVYCGLLSSILVLDERVQAELEHPHPHHTGSGQPVSLGRALRWSRIYCPPKNVTDLDNPDTEQLISYLEIFCQENVALDFVVIHQGIFEKLGEASFSKLLDRLRPLVRCHAIKDRVVIVSGRGVPRTMPKQTPRFVSISSILPFLTQHPSKFDLWACLIHASIPREA